MFSKKIEKKTLFAQQRDKDYLFVINEVRILSTTFFACSCSLYSSSITFY